MNVQGQIWRKQHKDLESYVNLTNERECLIYT